MGVWKRSRNRGDAKVLRVGVMRGAWNGGYAINYKLGDYAML